MDYKEGSDGCVEFTPKKQNLLFFFQKSKDIKVNVEPKNGEKKATPQNAQLINTSTVVSVKTNWSQHVDYVAAFVDGSECDFLFYTNKENDAITMFDFLNMRNCVFHFHKDSDIKVGDKHFSNFAPIDDKKPMVNLSTINDKQNQAKGQIVRGFAFVGKTSRHANANSDTDSDSEIDLNVRKAENVRVMIYGLILLVCGFLVYITMGITFATDCCLECCCCCPDFCEEKGPRSYDFDNRDNGFYTKTLVETGDLKK